MLSQRITIILLFNLSLWLGAGWWSSQTNIVPEVVITQPVKTWAINQIWSASSTVVYSLEQGVLLTQNSQQLRPIASLSKLVTALVVLNQQPDWTAHYTIQNEDQRYGNLAYFYPGETVTIENLWRASLIASDNTATQALIRAVGLTDQQFQDQVVVLAQQLSIEDQLQIVEPTGLNPANQATARAMVAIAQVAFSQPLIQEVTLMDVYEFTTEQGRFQRVTNTNGFINQSFDQPAGWQTLGGKTGYIDEAGYCFVAFWQQSDGQQLISVVLGTPVKDGRFTITQDLLDYISQKYY